MKKNLLISVLMTIVTTVLLGLVYPLVVTGLAQLFFPEKANGQLIRRNGTVIGSHIIAQPFVGAGYFHPRPSAAGANGYDASNSAGSNLGPTNQKLIDRVNADVASAQAENPGKPVPIDLVTTSASGFDPHITPAAAEFQVPRVAKARAMSEEAVRALVAQHTQGRQWGFFGEPRVNVLELNLALDSSGAGIFGAVRHQSSGHPRWSHTRPLLADLGQQWIKRPFHVLIISILGPPLPVVNNDSCRVVFVAGASPEGVNATGDELASASIPKDSGRLVSQLSSNTFDLRTSMTLKVFSAPSAILHGTMMSPGANTMRAGTESACFTSS